MKLTLAILLAAVTANAATYYVATTGSDSADGSLATPWLTIQHAITNAVAGDTVTIKAGEYKEYLIFKNSGSAGSPITFQGERSGTNWLTIIDPSTAVTNGWVAAPEIGAGVYKHESLPFETHELTIDHKRVAFVYTTNAMAGDIDNCYTSSGMTTGAQVLALASDAALVSAYDGRTLTFWDGVEALWSAEGTTTYLRLRDGGDPNGLDIRIAVNSGELYNEEVTNPALILDDRSYLTIKNLKIRGAFGNMRLLNAACHHNLVQSNYLANGYCRVLLGDGAHDNVIRDNDMTEDYYGTSDTGAWGNGAGSTYNARAHLYLVAKHLMGHSSNFGNFIKFGAYGSNNEVYNNRMIGGLANAIALLIGTDALIHGNTISGMPSCGIIVMISCVNTRIYDNLIADCNTNLRYHQMNYAGETDRSVYVYRNKCWLPSNVGDQIYLHCYDHGGTYCPTFWTYHNSFSGGKVGISSGLPNALIPTYQFTNVRFINNVFSAQTLWIGNVTIDFFNQPGMFGAFNYNELTPPLITFPSSSPPVWAGTNNVTAGIAEWGTSLPTFVLRSTSPAINAGCNMPVLYPALPQDGTTIVGGAWDMGALEWSSPVAITRLRVTHMKGKP